MGDRQNWGLTTPLWLVMPANFAASPQLFLLSKIHPDPLYNCGHKLISWRMV
ncbi:hypothetical protein [Pleurocapsa sp. CCALA 161]|uniref:hypothetical protein n=1 Tax=Pleurocapsa sp. CCALA 161 TaxID=2107688 RepID=UPI001305007C|nr:hypothetical protein [Pleurocapsa sp. CCALA 161]